MANVTTNLNYRRLILKLILKKWDMKVYTRLNWYRIGSSVNMIMKVRFPQRLVMATKHFGSFPW